MSWRREPGNSLAFEWKPNWGFTNDRDGKGGSERSGLACLIQQKRIHGKIG